MSGSTSPRQTPVTLTASKHIISSRIQQYTVSWQNPNEPQLRLFACVQESSPAQIRWPCLHGHRVNIFAGLRWKDKETERLLRCDIVEASDYMHHGSIPHRTVTGLEFVAKIKQLFHFEILPTNCGTKEANFHKKVDKRRNRKTKENFKAWQCSRYPCQEQRIVRYSVSVAPCTAAQGRNSYSADSKTSMGSTPYLPR